MLVKGKCSAQHQGRRNYARSAKGDRQPGRKRGGSRDSFPPAPTWTPGLRIAIKPPVPTGEIEAESTGTDLETAIEAFEADEATQSKAVTTEMKEPISN